MEKNKNVRSKKYVFDLLATSETLPMYKMYNISKLATCLLHEFRYVEQLLLEEGRPFLFLIVGVFFVKSF